MSYQRFEAEELTLRDQLAVDRTWLANERTLLAYLRTAFMLLIAGGTAIRLFGDSLSVVATAWALIVLGVIFLVIGGYRFVVTRREIAKIGKKLGASEEKRDVLA